MMMKTRKEKAQKMCSSLIECETVNRESQVVEDCVCLCVPKSVNKCYNKNIYNIK